MTDASVSEQCISDWNVMRNDTNFQYVNQTSLDLCFVKYQNAVALDPNGTRTTAVVECEYHEYVEFCKAYVNGGKQCMLNTGWLSFNLCLPGSCTDSDFMGIVTEFYNANTSSISCEAPPPSAIIPAIVSTASVLAITILLIFSFKPPTDVIEARKLEKAKTMMRALRTEAAHTNIIDAADYDGTAGT
jgi:hypothetical protein